LKCEGLEAVKDVVVAVTSINIIVLVWKKTRGEEIYGVE